MDIGTFEQLVAEALDTLPEQFGNLLNNVEIVTQDWPTRQDLILGKVPQGSTLFGLYHGIPQTKRAHYHAVLPDKIIIFLGPMLATYGDNEETLRKQVRNTVLHEIGHHFGMSEEQIRTAQSSI